MCLPVKGETSFHAFKFKHGKEWSFINKQTSLLGSVVTIMDSFLTGFINIRQ